MKKINYQKIGAVALSAIGFLGPVVVFAQAYTSNEGALTNISDLAGNIKDIIGILIPAAFALAVLAFFWGVAKYIFSAGDEESKAQGQSIMIGGVIGLFVIAMVWGLVAFLGNTLLGSGTAKKNQNVPTINTKSGNGFTGQGPNI